MNNYSYPLPILYSKRLMLRSFDLDDSPTVHCLCSDYEIYATTLNIPEQYTLKDARQWIASHALNAENQQEVNYALIEQVSQQIVGTVGLIIKQQYNHAEMGYWIGKKYWRSGFATEAAKKVLDFGFEILNLNKIFATHFETNPASGRVLNKIGMKYEGFSPEHLLRNGNYIGLFRYGLIRRDWALTQKL